MRHMTKALTVSTSPAYTAGDALGAMMNLGAVDKIYNIVIGDLAVQTASVDVLIFSEAITDVADNAAFDLADGDMIKLIAVRSLATTVAFADNRALVSAMTTVWPVYCAMPQGSAGIHVKLVVRDTPTFVATTDLKVMFVVE